VISKEIIFYIFKKILGALILIGIFAIPLGIISGSMVEAFVIIISLFLFGVIATFGLCLVLQ